MQGRKTLTGRLLSATAVIALAAGLSACSIVPDWVDPTTWFGDDTPEANAAGTPDLANIPAKPADPSANAAQVADTLTADMQNAKHSADTLRGGTEAAAAPPPEAPAGTASSDMVASVSGKSAPAATTATTPSAPAAPAAPEVPKPQDSFGKAPSGTAMPGTLPDVSPISSSRDLAPSYAVVQNGATAPSPQAKSVVQTAELPSGALPVTPADPSDRSATETQAVKPAVKPVSMKVEAPTATTTTLPPLQEVPVREHPSVAVGIPTPVPLADSDLGFQPSSAPPLDPSVADFVAAPIVQEYRTAYAAAGNANVGAAPAAKMKARPVKALTQVASNEPPSAHYSLAAELGSATPAVVYFADDAATLSAKAQGEVRKVAKVYLADGQGVVRVVGHASSRTVDMPTDKHLEVNFKRSQQRANAVAQALIRAGVPAEKVLVEAVSDSQPVYYESMPKGEEGNRRVEIFLQR